MPKLSDHASAEFVKLIYIGDSGSGKTGSLISLVQAGYKLRILDFDNGLDALVNYMKRDCPDRLDQVEYETIRDKVKGSPMGPVIPGSPRAFVQAHALLDKWTDGTEPATWGAETILVIDSLTHLGRAAFAFAKGMNPNYKDQKLWYSQAQEAVANVIAQLTSDAFRCNVIVISHIDRREDAGTVKGYVSAVGHALSEKLPSYFNTLVLAESQLQGTTVKRTIKTIPTSLLDLKNPAPFKVDATFPLETGMAELFKQLKGI